MTTIFIDRSSIGDGDAEVESSSALLTLVEFDFHQMTEAGAVGYFFDNAETFNELQINIRRSLARLYHNTFGYWPIGEWPV